MITTKELNDVESEMIIAAEHRPTTTDLGRRLVEVNKLGLRKGYEMPSSLELARALSRGLDKEIRSSRK